MSVAIHSIWGLQNLSCEALSFWACPACASRACSSEIEIQAGPLARISIEPYHFELTSESSEFVIRETDLSD